MIYIGIEAHGVKNLLGDSDLLHVILARVGMVCIDDNSRIFKSFLMVHIADRCKVLVVVVWQRAASFVHIAPQDCMGVRIAFAGNLPAAVYKCMGALSRGDGVHHYCKITAGRILHAHRNIKAAGSEPVLLVFHRACAYCNIGKKV